MSFKLTYQITDSSLLDNPSVIEEKEDPNELELIEEIDEPIILPKPKIYYHKNKPDTNFKNLDTFYGIKNEGEIPVWNIEVNPNTAKPFEKLFNPTPIAAPVANWQIFLLILSIILFGITKAFSSSRFKQGIRALFKFGVAQEITREEKVFFHRSNILFTTIHLLTTSLFLYHIKEVIFSTGINFNEIVIFLIIVGFVFSIYLIKYILSKILFFIFNDNNIATEYIFNVSLYNNLLGICLIPVLCLTYFSSLSFSTILLYIALPVIIILFLTRLIRLFNLGTSKGISYVYIFLYICTLEILPLVVLYRIFILN